MKKIIIKCGICSGLLNDKDRKTYSKIEKPELIDMINSYMGNNNFQKGNYAKRSCIIKARLFAKKQINIVYKSKVIVKMFSQIKVVKNIIFILIVPIKKNQFK